MKMVSLKQPYNQIQEISWHLDYNNIELFLQNHHGLRVVLKKTIFSNRKSESYFGLNFQTVCRNWANKMALESWWKSASPMYLLFFKILYNLKVIWKTVKFWAKRIFTFFFKRILGKIWIDANDTALESYGKCATFCIEMFF